MDKLWKGKREPAVESTVIEIAAKRLGGVAWDIFIELDSCFESIASDGAARLARAATKGPTR